MQDKEEKLTEINLSIAQEHNERLKNMILDQNEKDIDRIAVEKNQVEGFT